MSGSPPARERCCLSHVRRRLRWRQICLRMQTVSADSERCRLKGRVRRDRWTQRNTPPERTRALQAASSAHKAVSSRPSEDLAFCGKASGCRGLSQEPFQGGILTPDVQGLQKCDTPCTLVFFKMLSIRVLRIRPVQGLRYFC